MKYSGATVAGFKTYHSTRGRTIALSVLDATIEAMLTVASEWIDNSYGPLFIGDKTGGFLQENSWPRYGATSTVKWTTYTYPDNVVPDIIIDVVYEAAYKELSATGSLTKDYTPSNYKSVSIDGAVSVQYNQFSNSIDVQTQFTMIEQMLNPLLDCSSEFSKYSSLSNRV